MTVKDTTAMIAAMTPQLTQGSWVYCFEPDPERVATLMDDAFAMIREVEGVTLILPACVAAAQGHDSARAMRLITLSVFSDLEGIGLTAAVAQALTDAGISCNVVAAYHHDHVFVPETDAKAALAALQKCQLAAAQK
ncbi:ACT domain-containing protein [Tateyamaria armeniaca]|uniref:ACT domain-containing protein n=1 Tax=Tateyamaria armeniaca TaxID=2518930 RepID=A0ABW8UV50_9RHOB